MTAEAVIERKIQDVLRAADMGSAQDTRHPALTVVAFATEFRRGPPEPAGAGNAVMARDADDSARRIEREPCPGAGRSLHGVRGRGHRMTSEAVLYRRIS